MLLFSRFSLPFAGYEIAIGILNIKCVATAEGNPSAFFVLSQNSKMKNFIYRRFKWIMILLGFLSLIIASKYVGQNALAFKFWLLSSGLLVFGAIIGMVMEELSG